MNAFRLVGDLFHLVGLVLLVLKIWSTKSVAGRFLVLYEKYIQTLYISQSGMHTIQ